MARTEASQTPEAPLRGRGIVITRPAGQSSRLVALIAAAGGNPIVFPLIDIRAARDVSVPRDRFARIGEYDLIVFVSANAVEHGCALLPSGADWSSVPYIAAVGIGTARALNAHGISRVLLPAERYDSEGLLALPEFTEVAGKRVLIVRGVGGRELLAERLAARGASVEYAECYERMPPAASPQPLIDAWRARGIHAVTITSSEGLRHLHALLPEEGLTYLRATPLFVTHERMREAAHALALDDVVMATPGDDGLYAALVKHFAGRC
jgi:uroporphyrinogen-III synthase